MLLRIVFPLGTDSYLIIEDLTDSVLMVEGLTDSSVIIEVLATLVFRFLVNFFEMLVLLTMNTIIQMIIIT